MFVSSLEQTKIIVLKDKYYLRSKTGIRLVKEAPYFRLDFLPARELSAEIILLVADLPGHFLLRGPLRVQIQLVQDGQRRLEQNQ